MTHIEELRDVIRRLHGVESTHVASVPVKEMFQRCSRYGMGL